MDEYMEDSSDTVTYDQENQRLSYLVSLNTSVIRFNFNGCKLTLADIAVKVQTIQGKNRSLIRPGLNFSQFR